MALGVAFRNFWQGFNPEAFFLPVLRMALETDVHLAGKDAEVLFESVNFSFPERMKRRSGLSRNRFGSRGVKRIWYTGENIRPPVQFGTTLSFDVDDYGGSNCYLPLLLTDMDWFEGRNHVSDTMRRRGIRVSPLEVSNRRSVDTSDRPRFCCAFVGNPEPTRLRAIEALSQVGPVDVFGHSVGRPVESKIEIAQEYRFMLCFENDLFPGYITEKILDAWALGCVPLWWGLDGARLLNPGSHLNAVNFGSLEDFASRVKVMDSDPYEMDSTAGEALLKREPSLEGLFVFLRCHLL